MASIVLMDGASGMGGSKASRLGGQRERKKFVNVKTVKRPRSKPKRKAHLGPEKPRAATRDMSTELASSMGSSSGAELRYAHTEGGKPIEHTDYSEV